MDSGTTRENGERGHARLIMESLMMLKTINIGIRAPGSYQIARGQVEDFRQTLITSAWFLQIYWTILREMSGFHSSPCQPSSFSIRCALETSYVMLWRSRRTCSGEHLAVDIAAVANGVQYNDNCLVPIVCTGEIDERWAEICGDIRFPLDYLVGSRRFPFLFFPLW